MAAPGYPYPEYDPDILAAEEQGEEENDEEEEYDEEEGEEGGSSIPLPNEDYGQDFSDEEADEEEEDFEERKYIPVKPKPPIIYPSTTMSFPQPGMIPPAPTPGGVQPQVSSTPFFVPRPSGPQPSPSLNPAPNFSTVSSVTPSGFNPVSVPATPSAFNPVSVPATPSAFNPRPTVPATPSGFNPVPVPATPSGFNPRPTVPATPSAFNPRPTVPATPSGFNPVPVPATPSGFNPAPNFSTVSSATPGAFNPGPIISAPPSATPAASALGPMMPNPGTSPGTTGLQSGIPLLQTASPGTTGLQSGIPLLQTRLPLPSSILNTPSDEPPVLPIGIPQTSQASPVDTQASIPVPELPSEVQTSSPPALSEEDRKAILSALSAGTRTVGVEARPPATRFSSASQLLPRPPSRPLSRNRYQPLNVNSRNIPPSTYRAPVGITQQPRPVPEVKSNPPAHALPTAEVKTTFYDYDPLSPTAPIWDLKSLPESRTTNYQAMLFPPGIRSPQLTAKQANFLRQASAWLWNQLQKCDNYQSILNLFGSLWNQDIVASFKKRFDYALTIMDRDQITDPRVKLYAIQRLALEVTIVMLVGLYSPNSDLSLARDIQYLGRAFPQFNWVGAPTPLDAKTLGSRGPELDPDVVRDLISSTPGQSVAPEAVQLVVESLRRLVQRFSTETEAKLRELIQRIPVTSTPSLGLNAQLELKFLTLIVADLRKLCPGTTPISILDALQAIYANSHFDFGPYLRDNTPATL